MAQLGSFRRASDLKALTQAGSPICTSISVTANKPTMIRMGLMPPSRSADSKVKRGTPETGSLPTNASMRPMQAAMTPRSKEPPDRPAMTDRPRMPSEKYAAGVKASAMRARLSVASTSTARPNRPPYRPDISEMPSASPALPWRAIS